MLELKQLVKDYGGRPALKEINFKTETGKIYGFLGPNGAGKSTLLNIISGYIAPTSGKVLIGGYHLAEEPAKAKGLIGYLPELPPLYPDLTPREYLRFVYEIKKLPKKDKEAETRKVLEASGASLVADRLIRHLSKGYRQRVGIAQALLGDPPLIILDEPTVGLDPQQLREVRNLIASLRGRHTVLLSSHLLTEISEVCDQIIILSGGRMIANDTRERIARPQGDSAGETYQIQVKGPVDQLEEPLNKLALACQGIVRELSENEGITSFIFEADCRNDPRENLFFLLSELKLPLLRLERKAFSLEEIFLSAISDDHTAEARE